MSGKRLVKGIATFSKEEYDDYQKSLSSRKEWPGVNIRVGEGKFISSGPRACDNVILISDSRLTLNIPMHHEAVLISALQGRSLCTLSPIQYAPH